MAVGQFVPHNPGCEPIPADHDQFQAFGMGSRRLPLVMVLTHGSELWSKFPSRTADLVLGLATEHHQCGTHEQNTRFFEAVVTFFDSF